MKRILSLLMLVIAIGIATPREAGATSVSSTFTSATTSSSLFVTHGKKVRLSLTGTWVGTVRVERSNNNGVAWELVDSFTANAAFDMDAPLQDFLYRLNCSAYTSGTVTYSIADVTPVTTRLKYPNIDVGSVAYASLGAAVAITATTSAHVSDIYMPVPFTATGVGILNGGTVGTNKYVAALYDATGALVAYTATAGATTSGANAFQELAFTAPVTLPVGIYYLFLEADGVTDNHRTVAVSTWVNVRAGAISGTVFGTVPSTITPPTSTTASKGPIFYLY